MADTSPPRTVSGSFPLPSFQDQLDDLYQKVAALTAAVQALTAPLPPADSADSLPPVDIAEQGYPEARG